MGYTTSFDYGRMAQEAIRERDALHARLEQRKLARPDKPDQELNWKRENSILYNMYLEQRCNAEVFARRARARGQLGKEVKDGHGDEMAASA